jgi:hypothetical protein
VSPSPGNDVWRGPWRHDLHGRPLYTIVDEDEAPDINDQVMAGGEVRSPDGYRILAFTNPPAQRATRQTAEETTVAVWSVEPATESDAADFQVQMNSFQNDGAGAGTYNHGVWFGFNAAAYASGPTVTAPGIYMGFEDNFHDTAGADVGEEKYGPEWYVGYLTPDRTSCGPADLRMFYARVKGGRVNSGPETKSVQSWVDIGGGATGFFAIMANQIAGTSAELAVFNKDTIYMRKQAQFTNAGVGLEVRPDAAQLYAQMQITTNDAAGVSVLLFKTLATNRWSFAGWPDEFYLEDHVNANRKHIQCIPGASDLTASTVFKSNVKVMGNAGFYGTEPVAKPTVTGSRGGNAALASLLTALASQGLVTDSTTA